MEIQLSLGPHPWSHAQLKCFVFRREQALERRCPGLLKSHPSRGLLHGNTMEKLIKKRNVPQKLSPHSKRYHQSLQVPSLVNGKGDAGEAGVGLKDARKTDTEMGEVPCTA